MLVFANTNHAAIPEKDDRMRSTTRDLHWVLTGPEPIGDVALAAIISARSLEPETIITYENRDVPIPSRFRARAAAAQVETVP